MYSDTCLRRRAYPDIRRLRPRIDEVVIDRWICLTLNFLLSAGLAYYTGVESEDHLHVNETLHLSKLSVADQAL